MDTANTMTLHLKSILIISFNLHFNLSSSFFVSGFLTKFVHKVLICTALCPFHFMNEIVHSCNQMHHCSGLRKVAYAYMLFVSLALQPSAGYCLLVTRGFLITHNDAPQSVGLLWTSDQLVAETST
jgi:hypothetical protein